MSTSAALLSLSADEDRIKFGGTEDEVCAFGLDENIFAVG